MRSMARPTFLSALITDYPVQFFRRGSNETISVLFVFSKYRTPFNVSKLKFRDGLEASSAAQPDLGHETEQRISRPLKASVKRCSDGRAAGKRGRDRRRVERRVDAAVADAATGGGHRRKPVDRRRAGGEKSSGADQGKVAGADDHALAGTGQLDRAVGHGENVHCHAKRQGR